MGILYSSYKRYACCCVLTFGTAQNFRSFSRQHEK